MSFIQSKKITKLLAALSPFICLAGIVLLQSQDYKKSAQKLSSANYLAQEKEQSRLIDWQRRSPNLGFGNLKANWSYLNFVQYFGNESARETIGYSLVPHYFETITKVDPRFTQAYLRLSIANSMYAGHPEKTIALMEQVLDSVDPKSAEAAHLWTSKGLDELLFMGDKEAAVKSYKIAAQWAALANSDRPDDLTIKDLASALKSTNEVELKEAQIRAWSSVLVHIKDYARKREILHKIDNLKAEILVLKKNS
ncbi:MAG TPA: hypothetical protein V6C71_04325 [Coleofasciculaceae cyanobacterium]|jgi:hypothetical protein